MTAWLDTLTFNADGLIPAIAQDNTTGQVLMMAWQNKEALELTRQTGTAVYFSRSRGKLWYKGETSGHTQLVHEIYTDCDGDTIILKVTQLGGIACHTGRKSCFYQRLDEQNHWQVVDKVIKSSEEIYGTASQPSHKPTAHPPTQAKPSDVLLALDDILRARKHASKDSSYVASLYHKGLNKILEKVGEEAVESILAAKEVELASLRQDDVSRDNKACELIYEVADTWFHQLVTLSYFELSSAEVTAELARRFGVSGIDEKNSRPSS